MSFDVEKLRKELGLDTITDAIKAQEEQRKAEEARKAKEEAQKAEEARMKKLVDEATGETKAQLEAAMNLIKDFSDKAKVSDEDFAKKLNDSQETISNLQDQIKQLLAAREGKGFVSNAISNAIFGDQKGFEEEVEKVVLLSYIMEKGVFDTEYGANHLKAVNSSSSIEVSTENYETIFSTRILRDIEKELKIGRMFTELPMNSKTLTMLVEPEAGEATWVDASTYGTPATTGEELKGKLGEVSFRTFKLAAKSFITDETEEDSIISLLPILRRRLIEAHAVSIEKAFLLGDGNGKPLGLVPMAVADNAVHTAAATGATGAANSVAVTARDIQAMRRILGRKGLDRSKLALVISMEAYYDLLTDEEWQDVSQVGSDAVKLTGEVGRIYGIPVVVSEYFEERAAGKVFGILVYRDNFVIPRQRQVTVERERQAERQRDAYYVTQRVNLQRFFDNGIAAIKYA